MRGNMFAAVITRHLLAAVLTCHLLAAVLTRRLLAAWHTAEPLQLFVLRDSLNQHRGLTTNYFATLLKWLREGLHWSG